MKYITSWSGGKDSTASIILEHIHGLPPSDIVFSEVMFDRERGISGELPEHIEFIKNKAIPIFESWGHKVEILHASKDYLDLFYHVVTRTLKKDRFGKFVGFPIGRMCSISRDLKLVPIRKYLSYCSVDPVTQYVGIAADEPERLERLKGTDKVSLLAEYGYTEKMAFDLCRDYGLLSPIYEFSSRGGCWFCPNQSCKSFARLKLAYPELWAELVKLSHTENMISRYFRYTDTFADVDRAVNAIIGCWEFEDSQLTLF